MKLFNSATETGTRIVVILYESKRSLDLQEIIYYDYLTLHYGDIDSEYNSLHPSNPFHSTEYLVKRKAIQIGLNSVVRKGILDVFYTEDGIKYSTNAHSEHFLSYFESDYFKQLSFFAQKVASRFNNYSLNEMMQYFRQHIGHWKGEFEKESLFRGDEHDQ